jgi:hypothetical protein
LDLSQAAPPSLPAPELNRRLAETAMLPEIANMANTRRGRTHVDDDRVAITAGCNQAFFIVDMLTARSRCHYSSCTLLLPQDDLKHAWYFNNRVATFKRD